MWMTIVMLCGSVYANSCLVVTSKNNLDYYASKEECFDIAIARAREAKNDPRIFHVVPMCQEIILDAPLKI